MKTIQKCPLWNDKSIDPLKTNGKKEEVVVVEV
jgi:hypothetical protein